MDFKKLPGKEWLVAAFSAMVVGLLSFMWKFFPILLIIAGLIAFMYWMQKFGKKKTTTPAAKPPVVSDPPSK